MNEEQIDIQVKVSSSRKEDFTKYISIYNLQTTVLQSMAALCISGDMLVVPLE
jgi:hypothetical protein